MLLSPIGFFALISFVRVSSSAGACSPLIGFSNSDHGTTCWFAFFVYQHYYATVFGRLFAPLGAGLCLFAAVSRG